ncbi:50S ribosomal protein L18 [Candidatus Beckwithbacteria bacterium RBG_13_42_9]|uniref:Large ribosomal subunit protein uL18 n=1 Tax=Candidatus Beckwithbacteria bacterium RBG_13_42_9 TaxID=1797457 RepID=A0A1F5E8U3_9BACT|nr:MAG: 50S ribosomal protein L18 [Candidatus Beckwithbacteria bacterium RBG_13_42_9]
MIMTKVSPTEKRQRRVRSKLKEFSQRPRLSVFRSHKGIYGQIIDDGKNKTLVAVNPKELEKTVGKTKTDQARFLGELLAKKAIKAKIGKVKFDRGSYKFHGRLKAFAQGARAGGLSF